MAQKQPEHEPTMEEILASIRRIINEDEEPSAKTAPAASQPVGGLAAHPDPDPMLEPLPEAERASRPAFDEVDPDDVLDLTDRVDDLEISETPAPAPVRHPPKPAPRAAARPAAAAPLRARVAEDDEDLVSDNVANAAASALGQLVNGLLVSSRSTEGKTLEDLVRELLRPMLKEWLDDNLREIVEARVADEIDRIASRARR